MISLFVVSDVLFLIIFFFSSRRRHTRSKRDWSSDVCSSDLYAPMGCRPRTDFAVPVSAPRHVSDSARRAACARQIGRASCRERVWVAVVAVGLEKKGVVVIGACTVICGGACQQDVFVFDVAT